MKTCKMIRCSDDRTHKADSAAPPPPVRYWSNKKLIQYHIQWIGYVPPIGLSWLRGHRSEALQASQGPRWLGGHLQCPALTAQPASLSCARLCGGQRVRRHVSQQGPLSLPSLRGRWMSSNPCIRNGYVLFVHYVMCTDRLSVVYTIFRDWWDRTSAE